MNINTYLNYEIERIINQSLYEKQIITEELYRKVNDLLLSKIEKTKQ